MRRESTDTACESNVQSRVSQTVNFKGCEIERTSLAFAELFQALVARLQSRVATLEGRPQPKGWKKNGAAEQDSIHRSLFTVPSL